MKHVTRFAVGAALWISVFGAIWLAANLPVHVFALPVAAAFFSVSAYFMGKALVEMWEDR